MSQEDHVPALPWDHLPTPGKRTRPPESPRRKAPQGRRVWDRTSVPDDPDGWISHQLNVQGPVPALRSFEEAARGPGLIPWVFDTQRQEEDLFALLARVPVAQRGLSVRECHALARQLAQSAARARVQDMARRADGLSCPLDLNRLLPVPHTLLEAGETDPKALAWLRQHWGVASSLRRVTRRNNSGHHPAALKGQGRAEWSFYSLGGSPDAAIIHCQQRWRDLTFTLTVAPVI